MLFINRAAFFVTLGFAVLAHAVPASLPIADTSQVHLRVEYANTSSSLAPFTQTTASWALARIAQNPALRTMGQDPSKPWGLPARAKTQDWAFPYDDTWGEGVIVYVVDSGVRKTHVELAGRVENGHVIGRLSGSANEDVCDHGTGVASLIAGKTLGIARKATIVPVRIADVSSCSRVSTTTADVVAGLTWVVSDFKTRTHARAGIINISWQAYQTSESEQAFAAAIQAGLHIAVSAGNDNLNQCFGGPTPAKDQRVKDVGQIVVGNMDWDDERNVEASNFGPCLTIFAPGTSMTVASGHSDTGITHGGFEETGTSLSTPLVAGTIASLVTKEGNKSPAEMRALLVSYAAKNTGIKNLNGSPDVLLQSLIGSESLQ